MNDQLQIEFVTAGPLIGQSLNQLLLRGAISCEPAYWHVSAFDRDFIWQIPVSGPERIRVAQLDSNLNGSEMARSFTVDFIAAFIGAYLSSINWPLAEPDLLKLAENLHAGMYHADTK
jgi:hypothetical protein